MAKWEMKWRDHIARTSKPGVYRRKDGGFRIRGRVRCPRTGKRHGLNQVVECRTVAEAAKLREAAMEALADDLSRADDRSAPLFADWAATVFESKVVDGDIASAKGREKWASTLSRHLVPVFGSMRVDEIRYRDVDDWRDRLAKMVKDGRYSPLTCNTWLTILRVIMARAVERFELERDPAARIKPLKTKTHVVYTDEEPNALTMEDVPRFLEAMRNLYPQHYAFVYLGIVTGLRPSSIRPLRRQGPEADVKWDASYILIRRSHTRRQEIMEATKTSKDARDRREQKIRLPGELVDVLRWHVDECLRTPQMRRSELLFPTEQGKLRAASTLDKPFRRVCEAIELGRRFTPRGMRRTFQDLARNAKVHDTVTRAISGHATAAMQLHYSSVGGDEMRTGLGKIIDLAMHRGDHRGDQAQIDGLDEKTPKRTNAESVG